MDQPLDFNLLAPAELLTYFVVVQLTAHHMSGEWLTAEDLVGSAQRWLRYNGFNATCLQRMKLALQARHLAEQVQQVSETTFDEATKASMFFDGPRLDFRSPALVQIYFICTTALMGELPATGSPCGTGRQ